MVLLGGHVYLFMRFGITNMIRKYTVHRGMFHSIPARSDLRRAGVPDLRHVEHRHPLFQSRAACWPGFMSHLVLDEIYASNAHSGRWRLKKSFGTAIKFWGDDGWANFSCYAKLLVVAGMILGEPSVMEQIQARNPELARRYQDLQREYREHRRRDCPVAPTVQANGVVESIRTTKHIPRPRSAPAANPQPAYAPPNYQPPANAHPSNPYDMPPSQVPVTRQRLRHGAAPRLAEPAIAGAHNSAVSIHSVTGPSFTSDTSHVGAKHAGRHLDAERPHPSDKRLVQPLGQLRRRGIGEARPPTFAAIADRA